MENNPSLPGCSSSTETKPAQQTDDTNTKSQSDKNVMPAKKKKLIVRQTKTSQFRMLKANPLLLVSSNIKSLPPSVTRFSSAASVAEVLKAKNNESEASRIINNQSINKQPNVTTTLKKIPVNKIENNSIKVNPSEKNGNKAKVPYQRPNFSKRSETKKIDAKPSIRSKINEASSVRKPKLVNQPSVNSNCPSKKDKPESSNSNKQEIKKLAESRLRRSLSAQHFDRKKGKLSNPSQCYSRPTTYKSEENLLPESSEQAPVFKPNVPPIIEISEISFRTPSAHKRRTTRFRTPGTNQKSLHQSFSPCASLDLHRRLSNWLEKKSKSVGSYHHLRCFGLQHFKTSVNKENKENDATLAKKSNEIEEPTSITDTEDVVVEEKSVNPSNVEIIWKEALSDLHSLILEDYPHEHCEAWLRLIHDKYKEAVEEPRYWECRAAIEQCRGNITNAVECYKHAIVQGAEIKAVDKSLEQLLEKFSLLNINSEVEDTNKFNGREKILKDARNVFKSTIIQFAVQERALKKQEIGDAKRFHVTPVRRSTRIKSGFTSTPGVQMYTSLKELDVSVQGSIDFQPNRALC